LLEEQSNTLSCSLKSFIQLPLKASWFSSIHRDFSHMKDLPTAVFVVMGFTGADDAMSEGFVWGNSLLDKNPGKA